MNQKLKIIKKEVFRMKKTTKIFRVITLLVLTAMLSIGFMSCDHGDKVKPNSELGTKESPIMLEYKDLEAFLKNTADSEDINYIELSNVSNDDLKGSGSSCSSLGELIKNGNKKVFLILDSKKNSATSVTIDLSEIGDKAFYGVKNLVGVKFSSNLISIGKEAFDGCPDLVTIDFSGCNKLKSFGWRAFSSTPALKNIYFSNCTSLKKIGEKVFLGCDALKTIDLSDCTNLKEIGIGAFYLCKNLISIRLPESLTKISNIAFAGCVKASIKLTNVYMDISPTAFGDSNNYWIKKIQIPDNNQNNLKQMLINMGYPENRISEYAGATIFDIGSLNKPVEVLYSDIENWLKVTAVKNAINYIKIVDIPKSELEIAAGDSSALSKIIDKSDRKVYISLKFKNAFEVTKIPKNMFSYARNLVGIKLPSSLKTIEDSAFFFCDDLMIVDFSECTKLTTIGNSAFSYCYKLLNINFPDNLENIGGGAFKKCRNLLKITIPAKLSTIGKEAFRDCSILRSFSVDINNTYFSSEDGVLFNKDKSILIQYPIGKSDSSYNIPTSINTIKTCAFLGSKLTQLDLSECTNLASIEDGAFANCQNLEGVTVDTNSSYFSSENGVLFDKDKSILIQYPIGKKNSSYNIPNSVETIASGAFAGSEALKNISFSKKLEIIKELAFAYCYKLEDVDLSNCTSLKKIESSVFNNCKKAIIKLANTDIEFGNDAFGSFEFSSKGCKEVQIPKNNSYNLKKGLTVSGYPEDKITEY